MCWSSQKDCDHLLSLINKETGLVIGDVKQLPMFYCNTCGTSHRHLRNIDCLTACTACLVCFISTVNGRSKKKKEKKTITSGASSRHKTKFKQSILPRCLWYEFRGRIHNTSFSSLTNGPNKLECLSLASISSLV